MAAHKGINTRLWLWPAISVALLLSIGVLAGDTSAATSTGAPGAPTTKAPAGPSVHCPGPDGPDDGGIRRGYRDPVQDGEVHGAGAHNAGKRRR